MTVLAVVAVGFGLALLTVGIVVLGRLDRRLARIESLLGERPAGLSLEDATLVAEAAARRAAAVPQIALPSALAAAESETQPASSSRLSGPRIKASGWAAGASETMRRLRQGA